jgi:non-ribosomal peptide synthetase component F
MNNTEGVPQYPLFPSLAAQMAVDDASLLASMSPASSSSTLERNERFAGGANRQSAWEWGAAGARFPHACVHELFEQQAGRDPGAISILCNGRQLTYGELNSRANQVARYLRNRGVGPETLVGVCLERSPELVIALFGVWKAGGAYIPLDPRYPQARLSRMANDAGMKFLLTEEKCASLFPALLDSAIRMDSDWPAISREGTENLRPIASPENLAYVMFTSGSTGQPKGAMIQHSGLVNYLCWAIKTYQVEGQGSVPVHSSIAFDSTVASLYPPLLSGGQIELLGEDVGAQNLLAALRRTKNRNKLLLTPAHLELLNQQLAPEEMADITKVLVIAGEALHAEIL